mgnify:CR=1 FL=1
MKSEIMLFVAAAFLAMLQDVGGFLITPSRVYSASSSLALKASASTNPKQDGNSQLWIPNRNSSRRSVLLSAGIFGGLFGGDGTNNNEGPSVPAANAAGTSVSYQSKGPTNEVVKVVNGMKQKRLGGSDIIVSELGLGTQRWASTDFNAPDEDLCFAFMDEAILKNGVNLIDTAEQYPIPSDPLRCPEGRYVVVR